MDLVTSDWHISNNPRDAYRLKFLHEILPALVKKHKVRRILNLGDITEQKDEHPAELVNVVVDGLERLSRLAEIIYVMGNHDLLQEGHPFFRFVRHLGVRYITKPTLVGRYLFLPFTRRPEQAWAELPRADMIFTHVAFKGATTDSGYELDGIDPTLLPDVPIISGDIHAQQTFDNITYVGAPYSVDFGDRTDGRILLLDSDMNSKSIKVGGPQKRVVRMSVEGAVQETAYPGDVVRIEVPMKSSEYARWGEIRSMAEQWATEKDLYLDSVIPEIKQVVKPAQEIQRASPLLDDQVIERFGKLRRLDEKTIAVGKALL
jgi:predicted phosphodiesterase